MRMPRVLRVLYPREYHYLVLSQGLYEQPVRELRCRSGKSSTHEMYHCLQQCTVGLTTVRSHALGDGHHFKVIVDQLVILKMG